MESYSVVGGDTLTDIASRLGTSVDDLHKANPQISNPDRIFAGQTLQIPGEPAPAGEVTHIVQRGDSLSALGQRYGVSVSDLLAANPQIRNAELIHPGDALRIPSAVSNDGGQVATETVRPGDTLSAIAQRNGVTVGALVQANNIQNPDRIYPGEVLVIPARSAANPAPAPTAPAQPAPTAPTGDFDYNRIAGVEGNPNVTPEFIAGVEAMAERLGTRPEYLLAAMSFETGGSFDPAQRNNAGGSATGLIQFLPSTARGLGTSMGELAGMSSVEQLQYVEAYFEPYAGQLNSIENVYTAVLSGRPRDAGEVLFRQGSAAYAANAPLDTNHDGAITGAEATSFVRARISD